MRIPPGYSCVCQPPDVCWNKPLKQKIRGAWVQDLQKPLDKTDDHPFRLAPPDLKKVIDWVAEVWSSTSAAIIANGFRA